LRAARTRKGVVTAQGRPVAGARVIYLDANARGEWVVETAADGSYEVPDPAAWASGVVVIHSAFGLFERDGAWDGSARALDVALDPGTAVEGRVVDERQRPVPGAEIWIGAASEQWPSAVSGADGRFRVDHAPQEWSVVRARTGALAGRSPRTPGPLVVV